MSIAQQTHNADYWAKHFALILNVGIHYDETIKRAKNKMEENGEHISSR